MHLIHNLKRKIRISYDYIVQYEKENDKKPSKLPEEYQEYIDIYKGNEKDTFVLELIPKSNNQSEDEELEDDVILEDDLDNEVTIMKDLN